jgi:hypothetical protein
MTGLLLICSAAFAADDDGAEYAAVLIEEVHARAVAGAGAFWGVRDGEWPARGPTVQPRRRWLGVSLGGRRLVGIDAWIWPGSK